MIRRVVLLFLSGVFVLAALAATGDKTKRKDPKLIDAPAKANNWRNPYEGREEAIQAGAKLFQRHCAKCHGDDANGEEDAPSLRSPAVQNASPGAVFWFLRNGRLQSGMPSWSGLPDQQRWQLVTYLKTLKPAEEKPPQ